MNLSMFIQWEQYANNFYKHPLIFVMPAVNGIDTNSTWIDCWQKAWHKSFLTKEHYPNPLMFIFVMVGQEKHKLQTPG